MRNKLLNYCSLLILALVPLVFASQANAQTRNLSLEDIKRFAIANNFGVQAAEAEVEEIKAQTAQKRAAFYPKISVIAGPEIHQEVARSRTEGLAFVEGTWNIFRGSKDKIETDLSLLNQEIAESGKRKAQFELELEIESMFYSHLGASAKIKSFEDSILINEKHRQLMRRKQQSGMASQADLMEFELRESYLRSAISSLNQEREEARLGLIRLMGPKVGSSFQPVGSIPHVHLKRALSEFLSRINANSEPVKAASLRAAGGAISMKSARAGWLPSVDIETRYGRLSQDIMDTAPAFEGTLLFKWEVFSGFDTTAKIAEATARTSRLENEFKQRLLTTMTDAEVNYLKLNSIQERVHVELDNENRAARFYNAVTDEYKRGLKNGSDLKNAEAALLEARIRSTDFKYAFIDTKNKLERGVGLFIETEPHGNENK